MKIILFITISVMISITTFAQWTQIGNDINGEAPDDRAGLNHSLDISDDGTIIALGGLYNDDAGYNAGHARVYEFLGGTWIQIGVDIDGEAASDYFGSALSLNADGTILAVGASGNDEGGGSSGQVRIFENIGGTWTQIGNDIQGEAANDGSGMSVCLSADGSVVAIGAPNNEGSGALAGHVRVYSNAGGTWTQIGADLNAENPGDQFGLHVSLSADGNLLAISAPRNDGNGTDAGHVRIFENIGGTWTQIGSDIDGEAASDRSGTDMELSGDGSTVVIGALLNAGGGTASGHVRVYEYIAGSWVQVGNDIDGTSQGDLSGAAVSINYDGSRVAIGAPLHGNPASGQCRVYQNIGGTWTLMYNEILAEADGDQCGASVKLNASGATVAVGSYYNDGGGLDSGHARVFGVSTAGLNELKTMDKKPLKIIDLTGRETENKPNTLLIYVYSDGTTEKVFRIE